MNKNSYTLSQLKDLRKSEIDLLFYLSERKENPILLTNKEIAKDLNVNSRTVNRALNALYRFGFIKVGYGIQEPHLADRFIIINDLKDE